MWDLIVSVPDHCLSFYFPLIYQGFKNRDPFIYLPFKITIYTCTSMIHRIASRKE